jgi:hypothetical protein
MFIATASTYTYLTETVPDGVRRGVGWLDADHP